jgi:hypothetical protein
VNTQSREPSKNSTKRYFRLLSAGILLIALGLACGPPATTTPDQNDIATAIQQTMIAHTLAALEANASANQQQPGGQDQQGQGQGQGQDQGQGQQAPTLTFTPSFTPSLTPEPSHTPTPSVPMVSVSVDTNCRFGPGIGYELLGALLVGEQAEIIARDPSGLYWYIKNPDRGGFCWLWGNYATTTGNVGSLPVFTPPATPTFTPTPTPEPQFNVVYDYFEQCGLVWHIGFKITNTGSLVWQSVSVTVTDTVTTEAVNYTDDQFKEYNGCILNLGTLQDDLAPGEVGFTTSDSLSNDPDTHQVDVTIKVCSEDGLAGTCITQNLSFTP